MPFTLHTLQPPRGSRHKPKRLGRGLGSGHGTFSTRGIKGQRARSGGRRGIGKRSIKQLIAHLPKFKGQKPVLPPRATVTTGQLEQKFSAGSRVDGPALAAAGLIATDRHGVKVLAGVAPMTKALRVTADAFSAGAKKLIEQAGGKAIIPEQGARSRE